ncbi:MAG: PQQ-binding-like beta-propeller repeat protein [Bacteroidota bacterium]
MELPNGGAIFSSPAIAKDNVVFGSGDGSIYCLHVKTGKLKWKIQTGASVLGSPLISNDTVFIGGSDHTFSALDLKTGSRYLEI